MAVTFRDAKAKARTLQCLSTNMSQNMSEETHSSLTMVNDNLRDLLRTIQEENRRAKPAVSTEQLLAYLQKSLANSEEELSKRVKASVDDILAPAFHDFLAFDYTTATRDDTKLNGTETSREAGPKYNGPPTLPHVTNEPVERLLVRTCEDGYERGFKTGKEIGLMEGAEKAKKKGKVEGLVSLCNRENAEDVEEGKTAGGREGFEWGKQARCEEGIKGEINLEKERPSLEASKMKEEYGRRLLVTKPCTTELLSASAAHQKQAELTGTNGTVSTNSIDQDPFKSYLE